MENQRERRSLRYDFSKEELLELGRELSVKNQEVGLLEDQKKSVVSEYSSRINVAKEQVNMLSNRVSSGFEMRDVECDVLFHLPERGMKTLTRTDTTFCWTEKMTGSDWNLFTQYEQEQKKLAAEGQEIDGQVVTTASDDSSATGEGHAEEITPELEASMTVKRGGKGKQATKKQAAQERESAEVF